MNWWKELKGKIRVQEPLKKHTTFKIGGPAKFFCEPKDIADLKSLITSARKFKLPIFIIGAGSNILANDKGIKAIVIQLNAPYFKKLIIKNNYLKVGSGVKLSQLVLSAQEQGLSGAEFLVGIPGTVGGALIMNAGIDKKIKNLPTKSGSRQVGKKSKIKNIANLVESVIVMDYNGKIRTLNRKDIKFGYRKSSLSKYIILSARLKLKKGDKKEIKKNINRYLNYRKSTQDLFWPSAGCIFKNPPGYSAGRLIDLCGLKGKRIADACVSGKHANFILNLGKAPACDVLKLMGLIKKEVKNKFNITLNPEIKIWQ